MKKAYSKSALAVLVLYAAMSVVSGILTGLITGIGLVFVMNDRGLFTVMNGDLARNFTMMLNRLLESELVDFILLGSVLGSAGGMLVGNLIMRKILPERNNIPIEKKTLSVPDILLVALMAFGLWGVGAFIGNLPEWFGFSIENPLYSSGSKMMILFNIYAIFGAPVLEELAFRRTLLNHLHPYGEVPAAFMSALLFGLIHGNASQFMLAFCLGLLLATVYQRTGRVIYTIALHFMINLTATIPDFFAMADIDIMTGWYIVVGTLVVAGIVILILFRKKEFLSLSKSGEPDPNAAEFKNVGVRIAVIGGTILVIGYEIFMLFSSLSYDYGPMNVVLRLIPIFCSLAMIILTVKLVGKYPAEQKQPEEL